MTLACGTYGFMIAADRYVKDHTDELFDLSEDEQHFKNMKHLQVRSLYMKHTDLL